MGPGSVAARPALYHPNTATTEGGRQKIHDLVHQQSMAHSHQGRNHSCNGADTNANQGNKTTTSPEEIRLAFVKPFGARQSPIVNNSYRPDLTCRGDGKYRAHGSEKPNGKQHGRTSFRQEEGDARPAAVCSPDGRRHGRATRSVREEFAELPALRTGGEPLQ
jgi:hypothetical protein